MDSKETHPAKTRYSNKDFLSAYHSSIQSIFKQNESDDLIFVPFIVLSRCLENASVSKVGAEAAQKIRTQALENGTIEVILKLLSDYSNHKKKKSSVHPNGDRVVIQLINRLLFFFSDFQTIAQVFNESKPRPSSKKSNLNILNLRRLTILLDFPHLSQKTHVQTTSGQSSSTATPTIPTFGSTQASAAPTKEYWAKGTGFGHGSTATSEKFNFASHLSQQKTNEELVTHLLNVSPS